MKINKSSLSAYLERLAPGQLKEIQFNPLKNVIAVDTVNVLAMKALPKISFICDIPVRPYMPVAKIPQ